MACRQQERHGAGDEMTRRAKGGGAGRSGDERRATHLRAALDVSVCPIQQQLRWTDQPAYVVELLHFFDGRPVVHQQQRHELRQQHAAGPRVTLQTRLFARLRRREARRKPSQMTVLHGSDARDATVPSRCGAPHRGRCCDRSVRSLRSTHFGALDCWNLRGPAMTRGLQKEVDTAPRSRIDDASADRRATSQRRRRRGGDFENRPRPFQICAQRPFQICPLHSDRPPNPDDCPVGSERKLVVAGR